MAVGPPADAYGALPFDLGLATAQCAAWRQQLADDAVAEAEELLAIAVAGHQEQRHQHPRQKIAHGMAGAATIAAGDGGNEKDEQCHAGHSDGEIGGIKPGDGARVRAQQQRQSGNNEERQGNPSPHVYLSTACRARACLSGSSRIIFRRSASVIAAQRAISSSERPQPAQSLVPASIMHTLMQGVSIGLLNSAERCKKPRLAWQNVGSGGIHGNASQRDTVDSRDSRPLARGAASRRWRSWPNGCNGGMEHKTRLLGRQTTASVPLRSSERNSKVPPCRATRFCTIGSPSPVPPSAVWCANEPWPKACMTRGISSLGMPGPVSLTVSICPPSGVPATVSVMRPPRGVNFKAFDNRLRQIWRMARSSAQMGSRPLGNSGATCRPLLSARRASRR